jgi:hypothetical protein
MKVGIEVEGRFKGIKTLFCTAQEFLNNPDIVEIAKNDKCSQIYISDLNNELSLKNLYLTIIAKSFIITIERTSINSTPPYWVNIILTVDNPSFWYLNQNDQVKFTKDQYVFAVTKEVMNKSVPADFELDIEVS